MTESFQDRVALCSIQAYKRFLPHTQHSRNGSWTVLAALLLSVDNEEEEQQQQQQLEVIALGTGVKCLCPSQLEKPFRGEQVHDMHAEVIARRHLLIFIYNELERVLVRGEPSTVFEPISPTLCRLRAGVQLHMFISRLPCGDASLPTTSTACEASTELWQHPRILSQTNGASSAPLVRGHEGHHLRQCLRTKPGRRDAETTSCMSCTDKLTRWQSMGLQGALLLHFLDAPLFLSTLTVVGQEQDASRFDLCFDQRLQRLAGSQVVKVLVTHVLFPHSPLVDPSLRIPAPIAMGWHKDALRAEILCRGRKQGWSALSDGTYSPQSVSMLSKRRLFERYLTLKCLQPNLFPSSFFPPSPPSSSTTTTTVVAVAAALSYKEAKMQAGNHHSERREAFISDPSFMNWLFTTGPDRPCDDFNLLPNDFKPPSK